MRAICYGIALFFIEIILQSFWIMLQKSGKLNAYQQQKEYGPRIDMEKKSSTPSMGGVVFILLAFLLCLFSDDGIALWGFPVACGLIGFIDDGLKFWKHSSEGFSSLKKLAVQVIVSLIFAALLVSSGDVMIWPGFSCSPWLSVPLIAFFAVGIQNAVNVTDGLDGLAAGALAISLTGVLLFLGVFRLLTDKSAVHIAICLGIVIGFLWHNSYPAKVFMGDTGSHFLAGMLFSLVVQDGYLFLLIPVSFIFGIEIVTVAIQIVAIRKFKRKVFRMSPLHHHFQLMGWNETVVVGRFWIAHVIGMAMLFIVFSL